MTSVTEIIRKEGFFVFVFNFFSISVCFPEVGKKTTGKNSLFIQNNVIYYKLDHFSSQRGKL